MHAARRGEEDPADVPPGVVAAHGSAGSTTQPVAASAAVVAGDSDGGSRSSKRARRDGDTAVATCQQPATVLRTNACDRAASREMSAVESMPAAAGVPSASPASAASAVVTNSTARTLLAGCASASSRCVLVSPLPALSAHTPHPLGRAFTMGTVQPSVANDSAAGAVLHHPGNGSGKENPNPCAAAALGASGGLRAYQGLERPASPGSGTASARIGSAAVATLLPAAGRGTSSTARLGRAAGGAGTGADGAARSPAASFLDAGADSQHTTELVPVGTTYRGRRAADVGSSGPRLGGTGDSGGHNSAGHDRQRVHGGRDARDYTSPSDRCGHLSGISERYPRAGIGADASGLRGGVADGARLPLARAHTLAGGEPSYAYKEVVRGDEARKALRGFDCAHCRRFFEYLLENGFRVDAADIRQAVSRHRHRFSPAHTPEGYWRLDDLPDEADMPVRPYNPADEGVKPWARSGLGRREKSSGTAAAMASGQGQARVGQRRGPHHPSEGHDMGDGGEEHQGDKVEEQDVGGYGEEEQPEYGGDASRKRFRRNHH
jgi:hypothetical protein